MILTVLWNLGGQVGNAPACAQAAPEIIDVNCDSALSIPDVQILITIVLNGQFSPVLDGNADGCPDACEIQTGCPGAVDIGCGDVVTGTTVGGTSLFPNYSCQTWSEAGPEAFYRLVLPADDTIEVTLSNLNGIDLDAFLLNAECDNTTCIDSGNISFDTALTAGTYFIAVDGFNTAQGAFTLSVGCGSQCDPVAECGSIECGTVSCNGTQISCGTCAAGELCNAGVCEAPSSCQGQCEAGDVGNCFCDDLCFGFGDCCPDICTFCSANYVADCNENCGDGTCSAANGENCTTCAADCACPAAEVCSLGLCQPPCCASQGAAVSGCAADLDCEACVCGNDAFCCETSWDSICAGVAVNDCATECGCATPPCGDGTCNAAGGENCTTCAADCACAGGQVCTAGVCGAAPMCAAGPYPILACDQPITGDTTTGVNMISSYNCQTWDESGPELVYEFTAPVAGTYDYALSGLAVGTDLDIFVLSPNCDSTSCIDSANTTGSFEAMAGARYYIVVDGFQGDAGEFTLEIGCPLLNCGDGTCDAAGGENCSTCAADCACQGTDVCVNGACGTQNCCASQGGNSGCESNLPCETCVCGDDPFCCSTSWDSVCAGAAQTDCIAQCGCEPPPCGNGTCDAAGGENCTTCAADCACPSGELCQTGVCTAAAACSPGPYTLLACNQPINGTTVGGSTAIDGYNCQTWNESGPEVVYEFVAPANGSYTFTLSGLAAGVDLDLFILNPTCTAASCTASGNTSATFTGTAGTTYYVVVDGFNGDEGTFTLDISCPLVGCGDGTCDAAGGENCSTCASDCACTGDDICSAGVCGPPNCCASQGTVSGCASNLPCENCVCGDDPFCCNSAWDSICAGIATDTCFTECGCEPPPCGNGTCDAAGGENCTTCAADCACPSGESCSAGVCSAAAQCSPGPYTILACNQPINGDTTGGASLINGYNCETWNESGPEIVYEFNAPANGTYSVTLSNLPSGVDLDVFVLSPNCDATSCIDGANTTATFTGVAGARYYVVVDGFLGDAGTFTLSVSCPLVGCGDGTCDAGGGENCSTCASDCACTAGNVCLNGACAPQDCCASQGSIAGCDSNLPCETCVCADDAFCCNSAWDSVCAGIATGACFAECGCEPPPCGDGTCDGGAGEDCSTCAADCACAAGESCSAGVCTVADCCEPQTSGGCPSDPICEDCVCFEDSFCCSTTWDSICAGIAQNECFADCGCPPPPCGDGTCDAAGGETCSTCVADCACAVGNVCTAGVCGPAPQCGPGPFTQLACGQPINGTTIGGATNIPSYNCQTWNESGPEVIYQFVAPSNGSYTFSLSNLGLEDLDIFVLSPTCGSTSCIASGNSSATFTGTAGTTYFIAVDGFGGDAGPFTLTPSCPLVGCGNGTCDAAGGENCSNCAADCGCVGGSCTAGVCTPFSGGCCASKGTPGCENAACTACVCAADSFCCNTAWDSSCASRASTGSCSGSCPCVSTCQAEGTLTCGQTLTGTTVGGPDVINNYSCQTWTEAGPERAFSFVAPNSGNITATLSGLGGVDLDVFILGNTCASNTCLKGGDTSATNAVVGGQTYFIVVDGFGTGNTAGAFTLNLSCTNP
jgi:hypothetical protein